MENEKDSSISWSEINKGIQTGPKKAEVSESDRKVVYVRLESEEYARLQEDSDASGESKPELLRKGYFAKTRLTVLLPKTELRPLLSQLLRVGNNMNQIARVLNQGFRSGFAESLDQAIREHRALVSFLTGRFKAYAAKS